jgi:hypothetical protein
MGGTQGKERNQVQGREPLLVQKSRSPHMGNLCEGIGGKWGRKTRVIPSSQHGRLMVELAHSR